jgi:hypothetical protein
MFLANNVWGAAIAAPNGAAHGGSLAGTLALSQVEAAKFTADLSGRRLTCMVHRLRCP